MPVREKRGWGYRDGKSQKLREIQEIKEKRERILCNCALSKDIWFNKNSLSSTRDNFLLKLLRVHIKI